MGRAAFLTLLVFLLLAPLRAAQEQSRASEAEEPDFFFLTGGPYTQKKNSPQIIWANQWFRARSRARRTRSYVGAGRFEWGLTEYLEADFEFGAQALTERTAGGTTLSASGANDLLVGVRYRLLREDLAPFTLTLGPQVIAPAANRRRGLGAGEVGYAFDVAAAKDWGGPVFVAASVNLGVTPDVPVVVGSSGTEVDLSSVNWSAALGWRALERPTGQGGSHDIHLLLEVAGARADAIEEGQRTRSTEALFAPAVRYGFLGRAGRLAEVGISLPVGLTRAAPDWGVILQVQFEWPSLF